MSDTDDTRFAASPPGGEPGSQPSSEPSADPGADVVGGLPTAETAAEAHEVADSEAPDAGDASAGDAGPEADPVVVLTAERDEYREALVRLQADFENYRKRVLKQQTEHLERAAEALVEKLLPVLDAADLALAHGGGEDVKQINSSLLGTLEREGLERIDSNGEPFDPTRHDAVAHEPAEGSEQEVVEVLRVGYRWKGRVLRPAMVKVRG